MTGYWERSSAETDHALECPLNPFDRAAASIDGEEL